MNRIAELLRRNAPEIMIAAALFVFALAVRIGLLRHYDLPLMLHEQDAVGYMNVARSLRNLTVEGLVTRPPGYPAVIAVCSLFADNFEAAARFASILMDALICVPLYALARRVLSRSGAALAALCWAFFSYALFFSMSPLSQSTWLFFLLGGLSLLAYALDRSGHHHLLLGCSAALFALSYLTRPEGLLGFGFGLVLLAVIPLCRRVPWQSVLKMCLLYSVVFVLCTAPYFIYLKVQLGSWDVSSKTSAALKGQDGMMILNREGSLPTAGSGLAPWLEHYKSIPDFLNSSAHNFMQFFNQFHAAFPGWLYLLALAGLVMLAVSAPWEALLLSILVLVTLPNYIVNISKTLSYLYSVFPLFFICLVAAVELTGRQIARRLPAIPENVPRTTALAAATLLTAWFSYTSFRNAQDTFNDPGLQNEVALTRHVFMDASRFIRGLASGKEVIMTRWGLISYYSGMPTTSLPKGNVDEVLAYGRKNGVRWLLIDSPSVYSRRQELEPLLKPDATETLLKRYGVVPVHAGGVNGLGVYVVYRYQ